MVRKKNDFINQPGSATAAWIFGSIMLVILIAVLFIMPEPSDTQRSIIRFLMALSSGFFSFFFVGGVVLHGKLMGQAIGAGGGFVLFILIQFIFDPFSVKTKVADVAPAIVKSDPAVAFAQKILKDEGLYFGEVNGTPDTVTRDAIQEFQKRHNLKPDGYVGQKTLETLRAVGPSGENIEYQVDENGFVSFVSGWTEESIVSAKIPQLQHIAGAHKDGIVRFYMGAVADLLAAWQEIEQKNLLHLVKSWDGSYVPRTVRGSPGRLSAHALGIAFDINAKWNTIGRLPPGDKEGSVEQLVPIFEKHGFLWGGKWARPEGGHFQWNKGAKSAASLSQ